MKKRELKARITELEAQVAELEQELAEARGLFNPWKRPYRIDSGGTITIKGTNGVPWYETRQPGDPGYRPEFSTIDSGSYNPWISPISTTDGRWA